jgi:hypothetical protein
MSGLADIINAGSFPIYVGLTAPATLQKGQAWFNTATQVLSVYDGNSWLAAVAALPPIKLDDLTDVIVTNPVGIDGMVLRYNDATKQWLNDENVDGGIY